MFSDMITRVPKLYDTVKTLSAGRPPLRLATMCSGTESPLLAIKLIGEALSAKLGIPDVLKIHHVFSCEIEPFKQAYIDRNFSPPILFRDVRQLCNDTATTAYGATVAVPGNVDILIAGTSCVDYSSLNNKKQGIEAAGESGDTFRGMLGWVANHRPPIVILENVCGAPWDKVVDLFDGVGYDASFMRADTKKYYIPHTRTRVYLVALSRDEGLGYGDDLAEEWKEVFKGISRNASTPLEDYLLPTDDPRIHRARQDLAKTKDNVATNRRTEWSRCESRHAFARINEELGNKRPLTAWSEGGMSNFPDFAWNDWGRTQTDRVLDLSDINYLRSAKTGVDVIYKTMVWNLSQNVDRNTASSNPGICPCLTPTMIACITNRGGPLVGLEALSLQGIPVNELLLTRETEDQLADLAGNAMTSTVVGAAFLAALVVGAEGLLTFGQQLAANMDTSEIAGPCVVEDILDNHVIGTQVLHPGHLKLGVQETTLARDIIMKADSTSRHCVCEGREGISRSPIQTCIECNHSSCLNCGGRPEHVYDASNTISPQSRSNPSRFADTFKSSLPMRLFINWITLDALNEIADSMKPSPKSVDLELFKAWADIVSGVLAPTETQKVCEFRFSTLKRQEVWTAVYVSDRARLVLDLDPKAPQWELYVCAPKGTVGAVREALKSPVAHMKIDLAADPMITLSDALVKGKWAVFIPALFKFKVSVTGEGQLVDSWEARLGLEGRFKGNQVWSNWRVKNVSDDTITLPFGGIDGTYRAIAKCGTAMDYLHVKKAEENGNPLDLFFFLDPTRCGNPSEDPFVFATRSRRLEYGEQRSPIALIDPSWRPTAEAGEQMVDASVHGIWADLNGSVSMSMTELETKQADIAVLQKQDFIPFMESISTTQARCCGSSVALVELKVELGTYVEDVWSKNDWNEVDLVKSGKAVFEKVAWFSERINMPTWVTDWTFMDAKELGLGCLTHGTSPCTKCAPNEPKILWIPNTKGNAKSFVAIEDPSQAGVYENALKNRPNVFVCQLKLEENDAKKNVGIFRVGLNFASLIHRAAARLITVPFSVDSSATGFEFSWKLTCDPTFSSVSRSMVLPKLELKSNRHDPQVPQPPNFKKYPLRPEQVRSLGWMIRQEEEPVEFTEEEISEASLEYLGWRAEGRASRSVLIRGGVVADEVGYGKTAITLGLIDHGKNEKSYNEPRPEMHGRIPVKATLILVPGHLLKQWPSEIKKFTGETLTTIVITDVGNLNKLTIREVMKADIVITSSKIFNSAKYWDNVEVFAANGRLPPDPKKGGRYFNSRYQDCLESMKNQVEKLKKGELSDMISNIEAAMDQAVLDDEKAKTLNLVQTKRLKGKQYRDKSKKASGKSEEMEVDEAEEEEEEDAEEEIKSAKKHKLGKSSLADPWGLMSGDVKKSWKNLKCPPFELFHWNRLVVDEFTYLTDRIHAAVINVSSVNRWILSGTPPVKDFNDIKSIAVFLGVHLGVDDESDFSGVKAKRRKREATSVEQFHAFREIHTHEWHARRHGIAQGFLNQFVRQNIAEIDEIFAEEVLIRVELPPAERAIYLELEHHLQALDMNSKKAIKFKTGMDGDRDRRMVTALGASSTAEEALMKRCSHFALDEGTDGGGKAARATAGDESEEEDEEIPDDKPVKESSYSSPNANRKLMTAAETCREIVSTRNRQLIECVSDLWTQINRIKLTRQTAKSRSDYKDHCRSTRSKDATDSVDHFDKWLMMVGSGGHVGDVEAMAIIVVLIHKARCVDEGSVADDLISKAYKELLGPEKTVEIVENVLKIRGLVDIDLKAVLKAGGVKGSAGKQSDSKGSKAAKKKSEDDAEADENGDFEATLAKISGKGKFDLLEVLHFIREETHAGGRLQKELVGRVRSLRFFNGVDSIVLSDQRFDILSSAIRNCSQESCTSDKNVTPEKVEYVVQNSAILSCCGHMGCLSCVERSAANQKCLQKGCSIVVHDKAIVPTTVFGDLLSTDATGSSTASGRFGAKLMQLVKIIQEHVLPNKEKVLIFVQFDDLMEKVGHALDQFGIEHLEIKGSSSAKSSALALFQNAEGGGGKGNAKSPPVLLLNVGDESAAGANLTVANHVVFLNPLFHQSNEWIQACETQAIGRCRRYGQQKKVWIYRMLASETIDTVLFEKRANFINSQ
ncbi:helicase-like transcription factor HLTF/DNA helicase RAD5, DEAD-box superfamily [Obelidium mucronatum]|nr:helicase-like transcription factor HLTF/DNA helicase RAD5, DEAD-box superfamily [Obelidium mucronatum]